MRHIAGARHGQPRADRQGANAHEAHAPRPPGQDLRHALGLRLAEPRLCLAGRQADRVGQPHDEQGARYPATLQLGDDVRVRALRELRSLRRPR